MSRDPSLTLTNPLLKEVDAFVVLSGSMLTLNDELDGGLPALVVPQAILPFWHDARKSQDQERKRDHKTRQRSPSHICKLSPDRKQISADSAD